MTMYRLPCQNSSCDAELKVDASQAGLTVNCPRCGTPHEVPTIRGLNQLQRIEAEGEGNPTSSWGPPQSIMTVGSLICLVFATAAIMLLLVSPHHPHDDFTPPQPIPRDVSVGRLMDEWRNVHKGLSAPTFGETVDYERAQVARQYWAIACFVGAGLGLVLAGIGWSMKKH